MRNPMIGEGLYRSMGAVSWFGDVEDSEGAGPKEHDDI